MKKTLFLILLIGLGSRANAQLSNSNATAANQQSILTRLNSLPVSATVLNSIGVASGSITANAGSGTFTTSGTVIFNGIQPVSATIGTNVNVNTHAVTQSGSWSQSILNSLGIASGTLTGITNTVNVSSTGTVPVSATISNLVTVSGTVSQNGTWAVSATGTVQTQVLPSSNSVNALTNADNPNSSFVPKLSVKGSAGRIYLLTGMSTSQSTQYIQVFNSATQPSANAAPSVTIMVPPMSNFSYDFGSWGRYHSQGIYIANSSSATAYVNGTSDTWLNVEYQ